MSPAARPSPHETRDPVTGQHPRMLAPLLAAVAVALAALTGCGGDSTAPRQPSQQSSPSAPVSTLARATVGERLVLTAAVRQVLSERSFTMRDADLPDPGALVIAVSSTGVSSRSLTDLEPDELVTVDGSVQRFRFQDFAGYDLGDRDRYRAYEGAKYVAANAIQIR